jgi:hypothetical protein
VERASTGREAARECLSPELGHSHAKILFTALALADEMIQLTHQYRDGEADGTRLYSSVPASCCASARSPDLRAADYG